MMDAISSRLANFIVKKKETLAVDCLSIKVLRMVEHLEIGKNITSVAIISLDVVVDAI